MAFGAPCLQGYGPARAAPGNVGCDLRWFLEGPRPAFIANKQRVLRCIDLGWFGIFDLDAYGSPWEAALIIAGRCIVRPGRSSMKLEV